MEFTIKLEDFHDEEYGSIKDYINYQIQYQIKNALSIDLTEAIHNKINEAVSSLIDEKTSELFQEQINRFGMKFLDDYMGKKITTTDRYGDTIFKGTIKEQIHEMFDKYFDEKVDKDGNTSSYSSSRDYTRGEQITRKILDSKFSEFAKQTVKETKEAIEQKLTEELKTAVGKSVVDQMGIPTLLESIKTGVDKGTN